MSYLGDYAEDATVHFKWNSFDSSGASITRSTDGTIHVYKDDATGTEVTTGITDTEDFDSLTGVHHCTIDLSSAAFYAVGGDYTVVLKTATIDTQSVNAVLAHFSIENRYQRGTDSAALATVCTETRLAELDAANLPTDIAAVSTTVGAIATYVVLADAIYSGGSLDVSACLVVDGSVSTSVSNARASIYQLDGTLIDALTTVATADANGEFRFPALSRTLAMDSMYYVVVTIEDALTGGTDRSTNVKLKRFS